MANPYDCVRVDKLKLKGALPLKDEPNKKRKKFTSPDDGKAKEAPAEPPTKVLRIYEDWLTPAEKKYRARLAAREQEQIRKLATKSHRERIEAFNEQLEKEPSHFDIPKVGPG